MRLDSLEAECQKRYVIVVLEAPDRLCMASLLNLNFLFCCSYCRLSLFLKHFGRLVLGTHRGYNRAFIPHVFYVRHWLLLFIQCSQNHVAKADIVEFILTEKEEIFLCP